MQQMMKMKIIRIIEHLLVIVLILALFQSLSKSDSSAQIINHPEVKEVAIEEPEWISLGEFMISYYCGEPYSHICNDGTPETSIGIMPEAGRTIAIDPTLIPYGTEVMINDHIYIAEDCGGSIKNRRIDVFCNTHQEALEKGIDYYEVFIKSAE